MSLSVETVEINEPDKVHLLLSGILDASTSPDLEVAIAKNLDDTVKWLVLDLKDLTFVSSAGLRIFAKSQKKMKARDGKVYFINLLPQIKKVFDIVKAVPVSDVFETVAALDNYLSTIQSQHSGDRE